MRLVVVLDSNIHRRWHQDLVRRLDDLPEVTVAVRWRHAPRPVRTRRLQRMMRLETWLHHLQRGGFEFGDARELAGFEERDDAGPTDATLDLSDEPGEGCWSVQFDGRPGEQAAVDAVRAGRLPLVSVVDDAGVICALGRPGSEVPGLLTTALSDVAAGVSTLVEGALMGRPFAQPLPDAPPSGPPQRFSLLAARRIAGAAMRQVYRRLYRAPHWRVGWRRVVGPDTLELGTLPAGWQELADDGYHFYADPFPLSLIHI